MVIGLGSCCRDIVYGISGVSNSRSHRSYGTEQLLMTLIPIMPQEIVFAAWLIAKGFNPSVIASKSP
jgi:hypothetical protein